MRLSLFIISAFIFSCTNKFSNVLSSSDSLAIQFKSIESGTVVKTVSTSNEKAISKLAQFIEDDGAKEYQCPQEGSLRFYKKGILIGDVSFNYSQKDCRHFLQTQGETLKATKMNDEAADFLKGLAEGKSWY